MILNSPIEITSRLLPGVTIGKGVISIEYAKRPGQHGRTRYRWYIDLPEGEFTGDDLQSGCQGGSLQEGLESLLSFLGAAAESYSFHQRTGMSGENEDLFPRKVVEWAYQNGDEISMMQCELEETKGLINEN